MLKDFRIGQKVQAGGKTGVIIEVADKVKVKFEDGNSDFYEPSQVTEVMAVSTLKDNECPFCKGEIHPVNQEKYFGGDNVYQCMKCLERFSKDSTFVITYKSRVFCNHCGMKTAKHKGEGIYKCEKCDNTFKLN